MEVIAAIQMKDDGGLNQASVCEEVAKFWLHFEIRNIEFDYKPDIESKRKKRIKNDTKNLALKT